MQWCGSLYSDVIVAVENNSITGMAAIVHDPRRGYSLVFYVSAVPMDLSNVETMIISDAKTK